MINQDELLLEFNQANLLNDFNKILRLIELGIDPNHSNDMYHSVYAELSLRIRESLYSYQELYLDRIDEIVNILKDKGYNELHHLGGSFPHEIVFARLYSLKLVERTE